LNPVKGAIGYCNEKAACMEQKVDHRTTISVSYSGILGEIVNEFAHGMGLVGLLVGVLLMALCVRQKGSEK
jgi:hypothetical protein